MAEYTRLVAEYARLVASVFEDSKILSDIWSDSLLKVVGHASATEDKKAPFYLIPLDF